MESKITLQKTSCYFCREWLDDKNIKNHLLTCGQVLEKCPLNCLSYIQRKNLENHIKTCTKGENSNKKMHNGIANFQSLKDSPIIENDRVELIEENLIKLRKSLNEEIQMRHDVIGELGNLKKRNQITDEWTVKVSEVLNLLQKRIQEEKESRHLEIKDLSGVVQNLLKEFQEVKSSRVEISKTFNAMEKNIIPSSSSSEVTLANNEWMNEFKRLESEFEKLKFQSSDDMNDCVKFISAINEKLNRVESINTNQHHYTDDNLSHSLSRLDQIESDLVTFNDRQSKTEYNLKQVTNTVNDTEEKSEKLEKEIMMYKEIIYETKQGLADLEEHLRVQRQFNMITNIRGHLIWKINHYSRKLKDAKESDVPLKSPIFSNKHYGYALRLDVHLNGIGTWKNRNLIACLTVVNGDFDTLLPWPCKLKADIILRDQPDDLNDAVDITKLVITKKRNDRLEYQNQFIHIPHQIVNSGNYIKNDSIIMEVKIQKTYEGVALRASTPKSTTPTII